MPDKSVLKSIYIVCLCIFLEASYADNIPYPAPVVGQVHNQGPIVITNVRIFDGTSPTLKENATVLIDYVRTNDRPSATGKIIYGYDIGYFIKEVATSKPLLTEYDKVRARVIDGKNKVLMPGLIDTHAHLSWANVDYLKGFSRKLNAPGSNLTYKDWLTEDKRDPSDPNFVPNAIYASKEEAKAFLMRGFTSVREVGGVGHLVRPSIDPAERLIDPANKGPSQLVVQLPGPRMWVAGSVISATAGHGDAQTTLQSQFKIISDPDKMTFAERQELVYQLDKFGFRTADGVPEVQNAVRNQFVKGVELIKIATGGGISSPHDPIDGTTFNNDEVTAAVEVASGYDTYVTTHAYEGDTIVRDIPRGVRMIEHADLLTDAAARMVKRKENKVNAAGRNIGPWLGISSFFDNEYANPKEGPSIEKQKLVQAGTLDAYALVKKYKINHLAWGADVMFEPGGSIKAPKMIAHLPKDLAELKSYQIAGKGKRGNYSYSNFDILKMVTANNGQVLEMSGLRTPYMNEKGVPLKDGVIGVIKPGAVADLLLVNGNPLESLDLFYDVTNLLMIMKDGIIYKNTIP